jgi:hypothetical protein
MLTAITALTLGWTASSPAHDIPADVIVRAFLNADGNDVKLLVRVPLESMRDVVLPLRGPGYLDIATADQALRDAAIIWIANQVELYEGGRRLESYELKVAKASLPSDRSFAKYASAYESVTGAPLPESTDLIWNQALLDVLLVYRDAVSPADLSIRPNFARLGLHTMTALVYVTESGTERAYEFVGDPGLIRLDPRWYHAFLRFTVLGFQHILDGTDHLLFILCLIIPIRRLRPLIVIVTAFTVAHSITLISSAFGFVPNVLWFPPLIETLIAASIVYMALENIVSNKLQRRWMIAFAFGLVHGFGFAFALKETMQFAGSHLLTGLLAFNVGVEFGQLFVVVLAVPVIHLLFRDVIPERLGVIVLSVFIAHGAWHWMVDRASMLSAYSIQWPASSVPTVTLLVRWVLFIGIVCGVFWLLARLYRRVIGNDQVAYIPKTPESDRFGQAAGPR